MFNMFSNNKGITMVESLIAILLTAIAIVALMPMQDNAIKTMSRSDYMGRAEGIMQSELESQENQIMNSPVATAFNTVCIVGIVNKPPVTVSGLAGVTGDVSFNIKTTTTLPTANSCMVNVNVTWTGNATGIKSSVIASRLII
jgi:Tfp pilus assembly protein PilV